MIFATVGTQLPFPRLIDCLNNAARELAEPIVAQTGASIGTWKNLDIRKTLTPEEFTQVFQSARVVVAHAGIGTILSAKDYGKPLVILPRRHELSEHRNNHQLATAAQVKDMPGIYVAWDTDTLVHLLQKPSLAPANDGPSPSQNALIARLKSFVDTV